MTPPQLMPDGLRALIEPLGYELVDVRLGGTAARRLVQVRIDVPGGGRPGHGIGSGDCERVSRALERALEEAGAVGPSWTLEVSSPGIERPVRFVEHWRRYVGRRVRLKATGLTGKREATIVAVPDETHVTLTIGADETTLPLDAIRDATLVADR